MMLSQYTQALEDARASVSLDAAFVKGYIRIAKCCLTLGDAASAGQALDKASEIEPKNAAVMQVRERGTETQGGAGLNLLERYMYLIVLLTWRFLASLPLANKNFLQLQIT